jgi:hypothetical protein
VVWGSNIDRKFWREPSGCPSGYHRRWRHASRWLSGSVPDASEICHGRDGVSGRAECGSRNRRCDTIFVNTCPLHRWRRNAYSSGDFAGQNWSSRPDHIKRRQSAFLTG